MPADNADGGGRPAGGSDFPELGSDLINVVQLSEDRKHADRAFCEAAVNQAAARARTVPFDQAPEKQLRWRRFLFCMQTPCDLAESCGCWRC